MKCIKIQKLRRIGLIKRKNEKSILNNILKEEGTGKEQESLKGKTRQGHQMLNVLKVTRI